MQLKEITYIMKGSDTGARVRRGTGADDGFSATGTGTGADAGSMVGDKLRLLSNGKNTTPSPTSPAPPPFTLTLKTISLPK